MEGTGTAVPTGRITNGRRERVQRAAHQVRIDPRDNFRGQGSHTDSGCAVHNRVFGIRTRDSGMRGLLNELDWAGIEPATIRFLGQTLYH